MLGPAHAVPSCFASSARHQVGLVGRATPFLTGTPQTLYLGDRVLPGGVAGVAIHHAPSALAVRLHHPTARPVGPRMVVTRYVVGVHTPARMVVRRVSSPPAASAPWI